MEITGEDIFTLINKIRENPSLVLNEIKDQLKRFQSNSVYRTKRDVKIRTLSGKAGWQDTVLALERQKSKGNLQWNSLLAKAAEEYKMVAMEDDTVNPFDVIKSFCSYEDNISFNVNESDTEQDLMELAAAMVVGDGDEKKGSRVAIFHPLFREFACSVRKTGNKNIVYTIFAQSVSQPNSMPSPKKQNNSNHNSNSNHSNQASDSRSNWQDRPIQNNPQNEPSFANKYKPVEEQTTTKSSLMKRGKQLIAELNKVRKQPKQYVHALKSEIQKFKDDKTIVSDNGTIVTKEGQGPYYDLISELESQYPLPTIREVTGLTLVAIEQLIQAQSMVQYKVPVENLLDKFCTGSEGIRSIKLRDVDGMPISAMLMRLLVGDGDRKRTGRRKLLSPVCKAVGCAIGKSILIVNVGESAKDNKEMVEDYMEYIHETASKKSSGRKRNEQQSDVPKFGRISQDSSGFSHSDMNNNGDRFVIKKTSKSHNINRGGRIYVVTESEIIYNDGHIEKVVEEQLVR